MCLIAIIPPKVVKHKIIGLVKLQLRNIETNIKVIKLNKIPICGLNINAMRSTDKLNGIRREGIIKILFYHKINKSARRFYVKYVKLVKYVKNE